MRNPIALLAALLLAEWVSAETVADISNSNVTEAYSCFRTVRNGTDRRQFRFQPSLSEAGKIFPAGATACSR